MNSLSANAPPPRASQDAGGEIDLFSLGLQLRQIGGASVADEIKIERLLPLVAGLTRAATAVYLSRDAEKAALQIRANHVLPPHAAQLTSLLQQLQRLATVACSEQKAQAGRPEAGSPLLAIAVPIGLPHPDEALAVIVEADDTMARQALTFVVQTLQLTASFVSMWRGQGDALSRAKQSEQLNKLFAVWQNLSPRTAIKTNAASLVGVVQELLGARSVAIGVRRGLHSHCRLMAISGKTFDRETQLARGIEDCMDEAVLVPAADHEAGCGIDSRRYRTNAFDNLVQGIRASHVVAYPLASADGETIGCLVAIYDAAGDDTSVNAEHVEVDDHASPDDVTNLSRSEEAKETSATTVHNQADITRFESDTTVAIDVASTTSVELTVDTALVVRFASHALDHLRAGQPWLLARLWRKLNRSGPIWKRPIVWGAAGVMFAACLVPMPYRVGCDCELQPVDRRYVAVPYDGRLENAVVQPGDLVQAGQVLARMDGREIQWELGTLDADVKRAQKDRDTAMASYDRASAQMATLEVERLQWKMRLLQERLDNLDLKSPIDGIVIGGDPQQSVGARLSMGQTIVEVGPLDEMTVELKIGDEDIPYVEVGQDVNLRLNAHPLTTYRGKIVRIHPRSEDRESQNVFIAEMQITNDQQALRPGMEGRARISAGVHLWGWNLFHKAWESLLFRFGW